MGIGEDGWLNSVSLSYKSLTNIKKDISADCVYKHINGVHSEKRRTQMPRWDYYISCVSISLRWYAVYIV